MHMGLTERIRAAVKSSGEAPGTIAKRAGLPRSALSRLMAGKTLSAEGCDAVARALGMRIDLVPARRRKGL